MDNDTGLNGHSINDTLIDRLALGTQKIKRPFLKFLFPKYFRDEVDELAREILSDAKGEPYMRNNGETFLVHGEKVRDNALLSIYSLNYNTSANAETARATGMTERQVAMAAYIDSELHDAKEDHNFLGDKSITEYEVMAKIADLSDRLIGNKSGAYLVEVVSELNSEQVHELYKKMRKANDMNRKLLPYAVIYDNLLKQWLQKYELPWQPKFDMMEGHLPERKIVSTLTDKILDLSIDQGKNEKEITKMLKSVVSYTQPILDLEYISPIVLGSDKENNGATMKESPDYINNRRRLVDGLIHSYLVLRQNVYHPLGEIIYDTLKKVAKNPVLETEQRERLNIFISLIEEEKNGYRQGTISPRGLGSWRRLATQTRVLLM